MVILEIIEVNSAGQIIDANVVEVANESIAYSFGQEVVDTIVSYGGYAFYRIVR